MNLLIITSQVTYSPGNYEHLFRELIPRLKQQGWNIAGIVSLKTLDINLIKAMIGLPFMGVWRLGKNLLKNSLNETLGARKKLCRDLEISHYEWSTINEKKREEFIKENQIDLIINLRTRYIYHPNILNAPKLGCINIHHGILPVFRGTFCDLYALFEKREAGFSIHKMEEKIDAGEIYRKVPVSNGLERNYESYLYSAEKKEIEVLEEFLLEVLQIQGLPKGEANITEKKVYTKNPTPKMVKKFKKEGLIL